MYYMNVVNSLIFIMRFTYLHRNCTGVFVKIGFIDQRIDLDRKTIIQAGVAGPGSMTELKANEAGCVLCTK